MAVRSVIETEHGQHALDGDAGGTHWHEDHGLLPVRWRRRIGLAHEYTDLAARIAGARSPPLAPVQNILFTVADNAGADVGRVRGRYVWFSHGEAGANFTGQKRFKPAFLLFRCAVADQHFHVAGVRGRAVEHLTSQVRPPHDFA